MTTEYTYDIRAFQWNGKTRTFTQDAWSLEWVDDSDDGWAVTVFPSMKEPFYIKNFRTGEKRLFTFREEVQGIDWVFENVEDNITCVIGIDPF